MSTKQTQNYGLHLWEPQDKFLRTEFNENSTKIDTAIAALEESKTGFVKLKETTLTASTTKFQIDISNVDWSRWQYVLMDMDLRGGGYVNVFVNNNMSSCSYTTWSGGVSNSMAGSVSLGSFTRVALECFRTPTKSVTTVGGLLTGRASGYTFSKLTVLNFEVSDQAYTIFANSKVTLWGVS